MVMKILSKFQDWSNQHNTQITWFFLGFFLCDMLVKIGQREWWNVLWDIVIILLMYSTRKMRV